MSTAPREQAEKDASKRCARLGGVNCKIQTVEGNASYAAAHGVKERERTGRNFIAARLYGAETAALANCENAGFEKCEIVLSETCSIP